MENYRISLRFSRLPDSEAQRLRKTPDSEPPPAPLRPRAAADPEAVKSSSTPLRTPALARRAEALTSAREPGTDEEPQRVSDPERDRDS